jgi:hypothetical protein
MKTACMTNSVLLGKLKEREHLEELYVDVKVLQYIWKGSDGRMDRNLWAWKQTADFHKVQKNLLTCWEKNWFLTKNSALWSYLVSYLVISKINTLLYACNIESSTIVFSHPILPFCQSSHCWTSAYIVFPPVQCFFVNAVMVNGYKI